jgi:hypothetical protein
MLFSCDIPVTVRNDLDAATDDFLGKIDLSRQDIDGFICHHGVAKVIGCATEGVFDLPGEALVRRGPYRYLRHPNYAVMAGEITVLPLVFGAWKIAFVFFFLNVTMLWWRIRIENAALEARHRETEK